MKKINCLLLALLLITGCSDRDCIFYFPDGSSVNDFNCMTATSNGTVYCKNAQYRLYTKAECTP